MTSPIVITQGKSAFLHTTEGFPPYIMKWIGLLMSVSLLHRRNRLAQTCPVSFNPDWLMENLLCFQNKSAPSVQHFILKSSVCTEKRLIITNIFENIASNMQVESIAIPLLTIDKVEKVQRQKIASFIGHVFQLTNAALIDNLIQQEKLHHCHGLKTLYFNFV